MMGLHRVKRRSTKKSIRRHLYRPRLERFEDRLAPAVLPPADLVSWYRAAGNANDFAGGNHGTLINGATFAAGEVGQAFNLDGVDDFVHVPSSANLNPGSGSFTVDAWIFQTGLGSDNFQTNSVVNKADGDFDNGWGLFGGMAELGGRAGFVVDQLNNPVSREVVTPDPIPLNAWVHLAGVYDTDAHELRIYVNGQLVNTSTGVTIGPINPSSDMLIGKYKRFSLNRDEFFPGSIDEVGYFDRALSDNEIQGIFNAGSEGMATIVVNTSADTVDADPNITSLREAINQSNASVGDRDVIGFSVPRPFTNDLVSWYRAEGNADDDIGSNNGTLQNGATFGPGRYGEAFSFDGVDDFVQISDAANLDGMPQMTVDGWFKFNALPAGKYQFIVAKGEVVGPGTNSFGIFRAGDSGRLLGFVETTAGLTTIGGLETFSDTSSFHHVALTYDGSTVKFFLDGILKSSAPLTGTVADTSFPVLIGRRSGPGFDGHGDVLDGLVDEVGIVNRALSDADVQVIAKGPRTISPTSALPTITDPVIIDGYTQPGAKANASSTGFNGTLLVEISGDSNTDRANGLRIAAGGSTVRGLVIGGFNSTSLIDDTQDSGILLESAGGNVITGNFLGTDATGTAAHPNGNVGIFVASPNNIIGGTSPADRNVISGNAPYDGVYVSPANGLGDASGNVIQGNFIGTQADGVSPLGNARIGVTFAHGAHDNVVGGMVAGAGNVIAFNSVGIFGDTAGFGFPDTSGNSFLGNSIHSNSGLGIDLAGDGVTDNDLVPDDPDPGPNNLQNFPVITSVSSAGGSTTITGTLNSTPNTSFRIEFFASDAADPSGFGEGQIFLGFITTDPTDVNGDVSFAVTVPVAVGVGQVVSATATDPGGNTSEFSQSVTLTSNGVPTAHAGGPYTISEDDSLTLDASLSSDPDGDPLTYSWDVNGDGVYGDATGVGPTLTRAQLQALSPAINDGPSSFNVRVRVDDGHGHVVDSPATNLTVNNAAPTAAISAPTDGFSGIRGQLRTFTLTASDPSSVDQAANFTFTVIWGDGSPNDTVTGPSGSAVSHTYPFQGTYSIQVTAQDKDLATGPAGTRSQTILIVEQQGTILAVGGTSTPDTFSYGPGADFGSFDITVNSVLIGNFTPTGGRILSYGYDEVDNMTLNGGSAADDFGITAWAVTLNGVTFEVETDTIEAQSLEGQGGDDTFSFSSSGLTRTIDGGAGTDTLDYSLHSGVTVNLLTGTATGASSVTNIENLTGSTAADSLTGNASDNIINGYGGNDTMAGEAGNDTFVIGTEQFSSSSIDGGPGQDAIEASNFVSNAWTLTSQSAGNLNDVIFFSNIETLTGGIYIDSLTGPSSVNSWTLIGPNAGNFNGTLFTGMEMINGGAGTDTLIGDNGPYTWNITSTDGGTRSDNVSTLTFTGMENLTGGTNTDVFIFSSGGGVTGTINGGAGTDTLIGDNVSNAWNITSTNGGTLSAGGTLSTFTGMEHLTGGDSTDTFDLSAGGWPGTINGGVGTDTLIAGNGSNTWNITSTSCGTLSVGGTLSTFTGMENLTAGTSTDAFFVSLGAGVTGTINAGAGTDTLIADNGPNTWNITSIDGGTLFAGSSTLSTFTGMENLTGGTGTDTFTLSFGAGLTGTISGNSGTDTLIGNDVQNTWTLTGANDVNVNGTLFTSIEMINGGVGTDTLIGENVPNIWNITGFPGVGTLSTLTFANMENLNGGNSTDTFNLSGGGLTGTIDGGAGADTLIDENNGLNTWIISSIDGGGLEGSGSHVTFTGMENLTGGNSFDTFTLSVGAGLTGTINGGAGIDTLIGNDVPTTWTLTGANDGNVNGTLFTSFEQIIGLGTDTLIGDNVSNTWNIISTDGGMLSTLVFDGMENLTGGTSTDTFNLISGSGFGGTINGGAGTDTLVGFSAANTWNITSINGGTLSTLTFTGMENLTGGTNVDTFNFSSGAGLTGTIDGGASIDTLDYSLYTTGVTVNLLTGAATGVGNVTNIENVTGSPADDGLTGNALNNSIKGNGGSDTMAGDVGDDTFVIVSAQAGTSTIDGGPGTADAITGANVVNTWTLTSQSAGNLNGLIFSNIEKLTGGASSDTLNAPNTVNSWTLTGANAGNVNGTLFTSTELINGGAGADTLIGRNITNIWNITSTDAGNLSTLTFTGMENLTGGTSTDTFNLSSGAGLTGTIGGGAGIDTISGAASTDTFILTGADAGNVNSTLFTNIEEAHGGAGTDTLVGRNINNIWNITSTDAGNLSTLTFTGMENLTGGTDIDAFHLFTGAGLTGTIDGGAFTDIIDGAASTDTFILTGANAGNVNGTLFTNIEVIDGGAGTDTLNGSNVTNTWNITGTNGGILSTLTFTGMENLTGGASTDIFKFSNSKNVTGVVNGGTGTNTLDYSLYTTGVTVNLLTGTATGTAGVSNIQNLTGSPANDSLTGNASDNSIQANGGSDMMAGDAGNDTFVIVTTQASTSTINGGAGTLDAITGANVVNNWTLTSQSAGNLNGLSFSNIEKLTGGTSADTLTAPNTVNSWDVTDSNAGSLNNTLKFSDMENLVGGTAVDNFRLASGKGMTGSIKGSGGGDWIDYSLYTTAVTVNLTTGSATNIIGGISNIQHVRGGKGGNQFTGNTLANILIGGSGVDTITGGSGRNILIGRGGADAIIGGGDDDILIGGATSYDSFTPAHNASLAAILAEWQSGNPYSLRIDHIRGTKLGGLNGKNYLNSSKVSDDGVADTLTGGAGLDWFWALTAEITDLNNGGIEQVSLGIVHSPRG